METLEKVVKKRNSNLHIDLDPQQNIKNKVYFKNMTNDLLKAYAG